MTEPPVGDYHDVFISYASTDRDVAKRLAESLAVHGWSVWWDQDIVPGTSFSRVIEEALAGAKCVIVLWSPESVASDWVLAEAADARTRDTLVPAIIEDCEIPLEFRRIEAARIGRRWKQDNLEFHALLNAISQRLQQPRSVQPPATPERGWAVRLKRAPLWLVVTAVAVGFAVILLVSLDQPMESGTETSTTKTLETTTTTGTTTTLGTTTITEATNTSKTTTSTTEASDPVEILAADAITELGIGPIQVGMRASEIRDVLPEELDVEQYDQQGPLVDTEGVTIRRATGEVVLYALASTGEGPSLDILIFVDEAFRTEEGVGPGSTIAEATLSYGGATLSFSTVSESREFVTFQYVPYDDILFQVAPVSDGFAGIYPEPFDEFNETSEYKQGAHISTVWVLCRSACKN